MGLEKLALQVGEYPQCSESDEERGKKLEHKEDAR